MKNHKVIVYTSPTCSWCKKVRDYFSEKGLEIEEVSVVGNSEKALEMVEKSGQMGVPVVVIDDEVIVGYNKEKIDEALAKEVVEEEKVVEEVKKEVVNEEHKIVVYSTPTCHWCKKVKEYFDENNLKYEEVNVAEDREKAKEMVEKSGQMGVPVVEIDHEVIIGFNKEKFDALLDL